MSSAKLSRANWFGAKVVIGPLLSLPPVHWVARALLPATKLHRLPVNRRKVDYVSDKVRVSLLNPMRDQVAKDLYWGKGQPTSAADRRVLRFVEQQVREADIFLDIGSYSGLFALIAAKANPAVRTIAYELLPENHAAIVRNAAENGLVVDARLCGLGAASATITMPASYGAFAHPSSMSLGDRFDDGVEVPVRALDDDGFSGRIFAKIDVEGFEAAVIKGAAKTIAAHKPDMICEFLTGAEGASEIEAFLRPLGYRFLLVTDTAFEERPEIVANPDFKDWLLTVSDEHPADA